MNGDGRELTTDHESCAKCGEPAPYRVWYGDTLLARLCDDCHQAWWQARYELEFVVRDATEALMAPVAGDLGEA